MDSGYLDKQDSLDNGFDITADLLPEEVLWIVDELMCYEAAWLHGFALSQTVLTSQHIQHCLDSKLWDEEGLPPHFDPSSHLQKPSKWTHVVLRLFCMAFIVTCDMAMELITQQGYYEEEDFITQTYSKDLLTKLSDQQMVAELDSSAILLNQQNQGTFVLEVFKTYSKGPDKPEAGLS